MDIQSMPLPPIPKLPKKIASEDGIDN